MREDMRIIPTHVIFYARRKPATKREAPRYSQAETKKPFIHDRNQRHDAADAAGIEEKEIQAGGHGVYSALREQISSERKQVKRD